LTTKPRHLQIQRQSLNRLQNLKQTEFYFAQNEFGLRGAPSPQAFFRLR
jgi:hypothetical protein